MVTQSNFCWWAQFLNLKYPINTFSFVCLEVDTVYDPTLIFFIQALGVFILSCPHFWRRQ